ncbi:MurR/RpiR family transcriptional regulator [Bacillota bacterium Lsc_1132]
MPQNCLGTIRSYYPKFSEKEKKIADYILENPEVIIHRTINEVADDLDVADATVFRFSKRIGFKGFQAMKIALASETMSPARSMLDETPEKMNEKSLTEKIFKANIQALQKTLKNIESNSIKESVDQLIQANRITVYGTGASAVTAIAAAQKLLNSGLLASASTDTYMQLLSASLLTKKDAAIFISHSGSSEETLSILKAAKETGVKTIAITGSSNSPISLNCDYSLSTSADETDGPSALFTSQIAQLGMIDALCFNILNHTKETVYQAKRT